MSLSRMPSIAKDIAPSAASPTTHPCRVQKVRRLTGDSVLVTLDPGEALEAFRHEPGQRVTFCLDLQDRTCFRSYNLVNAPEGLPQVAVKQVAQGGASQYFTQDVRPGDILNVAPPEGDLYPAELDSSAHHLMLFAAGSGITPLYSIARHALRARPDHHVTLFYANRSARDIMFRDELDQLAVSPRLEVFHILGDGGTGDAHSSGRLCPDRVAGLVAQFGRPACPEIAFISGPSGFQEAVRTGLRDVAPQLAVRDFSFGRQPYHHPDDPTDHRRGVDIHIVKNGVTRHIHGAPRHLTLLEAADRAGIEVPAECRGGICHRCKAKLLDGRTVSSGPREEQRTPPPGHILCCQERPASDEITLDLD